MSQLIPLAPQRLGTETVQTVNARELHAFLGVKTKFNDWITKRIAAYEFSQDIDYCVLISEYGGPITTKDYFVSIDMAKELAMVERTTRGKEARQYFITCEKALHAITPAMIPVSLSYLRDHHAFLAELGMFEDRDRLMLADIARTQLQRQAGLLPLGHATSSLVTGFDTEDGLRTVAPHLTASQLRKCVAEAGKRLAAEYRQRFHAEPAKTSRYIDGKTRPVNWYRPEDTEWAYSILQSYLASLSLLTTPPTGDTP